jgi:hypothetical protein
MVEGLDSITTASLQSPPLDPPLAPGESWWDPALFLSPDTGGPLGHTTIDATGRSRFLFFGPYLPLERGIWRARVWLEICQDAARRPMAIQFGADPGYTTFDLPIDRPGPLVASVEHPMDGIGLAQVRLWLKRAAFHGEVRFLGAAVSQIADLPASSDDRGIT